MLLYSTNWPLPDGSTDKVSLKEALFRGQAPDGGLYIPLSQPRFSAAGLWALRKLSFPELAATVIHAWIEDEMSFAECLELCRESFTFPVPFDYIDVPNRLMRLDRGPTASFKDFAARFLARLMRKMSGGQPFTVLVATSGDTGSAVGEAFKELSDTRVVIVYPANEVSPLQKKQLDSIGGSVQAVALDGKFDDCQALVKQAFSDAELAPLALTSANSINIGRVLPQMTYYAWAWAQLARHDEEILFSVPSGNFGNGFGCELARRMGIPVKRLILATNANDEFPRFLSGEAYAPVRPSRACLSNSMNVGHPSNLARFFDAYGGTVDRDGNVWRKPDLGEMRKRLWSVSVSDEETRRAIKDMSDRFGKILEPHGAVAWAGLEAYRAATGDTSLGIALETADPAKFPETVREVLGIEPRLPESMRGLEAKTGSATPLPADYASLKAFLLALPH